MAIKTTTTPNIKTHSQLCGVIIIVLLTDFYLIYKLILMLMNSSIVVAFVCLFNTYSVPVFMPLCALAGRLELLV